MYHQALGLAKAPPLLEDPEAPSTPSTNATKDKTLQPGTVLCWRDKYLSPQTGPNAKSCAFVRTHGLDDTTTMFYAQHLMRETNGEVAHLMNPNQNPCSFSQVCPRQTEVFSSLGFRSTFSRTPRTKADLALQRPPSCNPLSVLFANSNGCDWVQNNEGSSTLSRFLNGYPSVKDSLKVKRLPKGSGRC